VKNPIIILLLLSISAEGLCQNLSLGDFGASFQRADLDVRWQAPANELPAEVWTYRLLPNRFPNSVGSYLTDMGSFGDKDKTNIGPNGLLFKSPDTARTLFIDYSLGIIYYEATHNYSPTNLAHDVPDQNQTLSLTLAALSRLGIQPSDISKNETNSRPDFHIFDAQTVYFVNHTFTTNIEWRGVRFRRVVDSGMFVGNGTGGEGEIHIGEHGTITKIDLSWRNLQRNKLDPAASPDLIMKWMREGKAVLGPRPMNERPIDWGAVKSVTVKHAYVSYYAGDRLKPSDWLLPVAALWVSIDTGDKALDAEIDCPIIDDTEKGGNSKK
jgi:hypothetical protein